MKLSINKSSFLNYILTYFMFALGGVTTFSSNSRFVQLFFVIVLALFFYKRKKFDREYFYIILFVTIIYFAQVLMFGGFNLIHLIVLFYTFFIPYAIIKLVGIKFVDYYINITYFFAIISFFFLVPSYLFSDFREAVRAFSSRIDIDALEGVSDNFIIYNHELMIDGIIKNPGPFYEAGAFGTFLIIALILNLVKTKSFLVTKNIVFILTILSTFSTAAYISLFALIFVFFTINKSLWIRVLVLPIVVTFVTWSYYDITFIGEKINTQYEASFKQGDQRIGRIQGGLVDWRELQNSPIIGTKIVASSEDRSNNGLTDLALRYGLIGFFLFFFLYYRSIKMYSWSNNFSTKFALFSIIPISAVLFGQVLYSKPIFLGVIMMFILFKKNNLKSYAPALS